MYITFSCFVSERFCRSASIASVNQSLTALRCMFLHLKVYLRQGSEGHCYCESFLFSLEPKQENGSHQEY